ncbi:3-phosphoshikimate 1-carboxyvinyltransferase [Methanobrevibacter curvatus]|uniref:3-phosphoshikimate 1-carboxyvinyltransferase n=1 Tax=Methanobrevibacter curvatus TaxID=49547 RepID=A0A165Z752_9EURY|nr:3-phosphoshikimate 1-carboxyvinyltransferase [Methanobrevibacter curvatus]KZX10334.1 3-phosphoshikimate 1-carboxyvinyltransferase [Methanobrevibacter curvatus]
MILKIRKLNKVGGEIKAPPSKSYTHRAIIISSFADGESIIHDPLISEDTLSSIGACESFGSKIELINDDSDLKIIATKNIENSSTEAIDLKNSGTTLRIMTSMAGLSCNSTVFTGDKSLRTRPMGILMKSGKQLGLNAKSLRGDEKPPIKVKPGFVGGKTAIDGSVSSQFISSLLMAGALSENGLKLEVKGDFISKSYVAMTLDIMEKFGVNINSDLSTKGHENCNEYEKKCASTFFDLKPQKYISREYTVEGDYSSASYPLSAVAINGGEIKVKNLFKESKQGDKIIINILNQMGCEVSIFEDYVILKSNGMLRGVDVNLYNSPDLLPTVAVLGAMAEGTTKITGVRHARFKETDRIAKCSAELKKLGCHVNEFHDGMEVIGGINSGTVTSHGDHRIAMAFSLLNLKHEVAIENGDVFSVSFPNFLEVMAEIGLDFELI